MEQKKRFSVLVQCGCDGTVAKENLFDAWRIYGSNTSFRSLITGNMIVIDEKFYLQLPDAAKPIPCVETIVISKLFGLAPLHNRGTTNKKLYVVGSPTLYFQALQEPFRDLIEEIIVMKTDRYCQGRIVFRLDKELWQENILSVIPRDRHQPNELTFIQYTRKAA